MNKKIHTVKDFDLNGKHVLVRTGYDVPLYKNGSIADATRIDESFQTLRHILNQGGVPIILTHIGRPGGKRVKLFELEAVTDYMRVHLEVPVFYVQEFEKKDILVAIEAAKKQGGIVLLENLRFHPGEKKNDPEFAEFLASFGDVYINEAFSVSHREHASIVGVPTFVAEKGIGLAFEREIQKITQIIQSKEHPMTIILGGAKIDTKVGIIEKLIGPADNFLIGGALANTFLMAEGYEVGLSKVEEDKVEIAQQTMSLIEKDKDKLVLPVDVEVCDEISNASYCADIKLTGMTPEMRILDIGKITIQEFIEVIETSKTIIWNGPLGFTEMERFEGGTKAIAQAMADKDDALTLIGGGDTAHALNQLGIGFENFTHVSTAGGALIEYIEKLTLPGIDILKKKHV